MIDPKALQELRDFLGETASETLAEVINSYLNDAPKLLEAIRAAISGRDAVALQQSAHTLKSSSATLGAASLSQICQELEVMGRAGTVAGGAVKVAQLQIEYESVKSALEAEVSDSRYEVET